MGIKKSKILQYAIDNEIARTEKDYHATDKPRHLCISVIRATRTLGGKYETICNDITRSIHNAASVETYLYKTRSGGFPSFEEACEFRINLANTLINRYKEEECKPISTALSKVYKKLKVIWKNKQS